MALTMKGLILRASAVVLLPIVVLVAGGTVMNVASGRRLPANSSRSGEKLTPLNQRWLGYDAAAIASYWGGLDPEGKDAERRFLQFDLVFPTLFAAALAASVLAGVRLAGRRFSPAWPLALVAIGLFSDWTENLVQLRLLDDVVKALVSNPGRALMPDPDRATLASIGTMTKLYAEAIVMAVIVVCAVLGLRRAGPAASQTNR